MDTELQLEIIGELVEALSEYTGVQYNALYNKETGEARLVFYNEYRANQEWDLAEGSLDYIQGYLQARLDNESGG